MNDRGRTTRPRLVLLVVGSTGMSCVRIPSLLARAGWRVSVLAPRTSPVLASRHVAEPLPVRGDVDSVQRQLRSLLQRNPRRFDWVILGDEDIVSALADRLDETWAAACFPVPSDTAAPQIISHKTSFITACLNAGIPVPQSRVCTGAEDAIAAADAIGFPLLVKADFGASGTTVWRIADAAELAEVLPRTAGKPFTVQTLLSGEAGVTEMLCTHGQPVAIVSSVMRGIDPAPFGPASSRLYRKNPKAESIAVRLAALTGFHGLCGFDWVQVGGTEGPTYAIEFHPRPTLGFHMAHRAGVDFAIAIRRLFEDSNSEVLEQPGGREARCLFFPKDLTRAIRTRDVRGLLRWLPGASHNDLPWGDPKLLWAFVQRRHARPLVADSRHADASRGSAALTIPGQL